MTNIIRPVLALLLSTPAHLAIAHPGPHAHINVDSAAPHVNLGWEAALILAIVATAIVLWRNRDRQR